ncbi:hypothetical protein Bca101_094189 [Brassica carinata]
MDRVGLVYLSSVGALALSDEISKSDEALRRVDRVGRTEMVSAEALRGSELRRNEVAVMWFRRSSNRRPGVRHSTFESLRLGLSSQSIASGFLRFWDSLNFKKDREFVGITVLFLDEKVNSVIHGFTPVGHANHYMPSLKADSIVKVYRFEVARCSK